MYSYRRPNNNSLFSSNNSLSDMFRNVPSNSASSPVLNDSFLSDYLSSDEHLNLNPSIEIEEKKSSSYDNPIDQTVTSIMSNMQLPATKDQFLDQIKNFVIVHPFAILFFLLCVGFLCFIIYLQQKDGPKNVSDIVDDAQRWWLSTRDKNIIENEQKTKKKIKKRLLREDDSESDEDSDNSSDSDDSDFSDDSDDSDSDDDL